VTRILSCLLAVACARTAIGQEDASIRIRADQPKGKVARELFGSEIKCAHGADGLMTGLRSTSNEFRAPVMDLLRPLNPGFMRYKFMRGSWDWEDGIGPMAVRKEDPARQKVMGLDEIMAFQAVVIGDASKCHLVVSPSNPQQAAALAAYLNVPSVDPEKNGHDRVLGTSTENGRDYKTVGYWATLRAQHGHPEPYGAPSFELGNECYVRGGGFKGDARDYCGKTREVVRAVRAVDPRIRCGLNLDCSPIKNRDWRQRVIEEGGDYADFLICHVYYPFAYVRNRKYQASVTNLDRPEVEELYYKMIMAGAHQASSDLLGFRDQVKKHSSRAAALRLCLTENGFHLEEYDARAQNSVLVGVYDADLLGMMVENARELALDNANLFFLQGDDPWAFLQHSFARRDASQITVRPPYWSLYLWTHYFGSTLLESEVRCGSFDIPFPQGEKWPKEGIFWSRIAAQDRIPLLSAHSSLSSDGRTLYVIVVNRDLYRDLSTSIRIDGFLPQASATVHTLNSDMKPTSSRLPDMMAVWDSNNEDRSDTVKIRDSRFDGAGAAFRWTAPAHSASAIVLRSR
jgi:alpha-L-arabinofuranosidase